jgi:hypothetical protein
MSMQPGSLRYWQLVLLIAFALISFSTSAAQQQESVARAQPTVSITIHAKDRRVKVGSPVWVAVTEKNKSQRILAVGRERPLDMDQGGVSFFVDIWDSNGVRAPESTFYRKILGHPTPTEKAALGPEQLRMSSGFAVLLKPGEKTTNRIDVGRLYDLTRPGKYTIQLAFLKSNKIIVRITP